MNLYRAFIDAGLIEVDANGKIKSWEASPWNSGGSSAIILKRPSDPALLARVAKLLAELKADPRNCISEIATANQVTEMAGNLEASFYVGFENNAYAGAFKGAGAPLVNPSGSKGMHGYFPENDSMRSSFMMMGKNVPKGRNLGDIDMRAIAPTLARAMGLTLPDTEVPALK